MAIIRPLSGSGAMAVMMDTMKQYGPDTFVGYLVSVLNGSMETTFYVLALYFGAVQIREVRHTLIPCLAADFAGIAGALVMLQGLAWAPDERSIVYGAIFGGGSHLWRVEVSGGRSERLELAAVAEFPAVSPAANRLVFSRSAGDVISGRFETVAVKAASSAQP